MKVTLLIPNAFLGRGFKLDIPMHPPLSLGYLSAVLIEEGHDVQAIDAMVENLGLNALAGRIRRFNPDVIGISMNIATSQKGIMTARFLRKMFPSIPIICGGPWATVEHARLLQKRLCDVVVIGEGEVTIKELVPAIRDRKAWPGIKGIAFLDGKFKVHVTPERERIEDLDSLPFPAWHLLPKSKKYRFYSRGYPLYPIMTSRGCPYDCIHCTKKVHGYKYRARSPENVLSEIEHLVKVYKVKTIAIVDDTFTQDPARAERILDEIIKKRLGVHFLFSNGVRADTLTPRMVRKFKAAGVYYVGLGIESGNQEIVNRIGKRLDLSKVRRAVALLKKERIIVTGYFIFGHLDDTVKTMWDTIQFAKSLGMDYTQFFKAVPIPGTRMYEMIEKEGRFLFPRDAGTIDGYNVPMATFEYGSLKPRDVEQAFKNSYRHFYLNPLKIVTLLSQLRSMAEVKWFIRSIIQIFVRNLF